MIRSTVKRALVLASTGFLLCQWAPWLAAAQRLTPCASNRASVLKPEPVLQGGADSQDFDRLRQHGNEAIYNLDFQVARSDFQRMSELRPDSPAPYVYLASCLWLETLNKSRRLSPALFSKLSFYAQKSDSDKTDPERDRAFNDLIERAMAASAAALQKNPRDAQALYYQAGALGIRAAYVGTVQRSFKHAISDANKAAELQSKVLKLDPQYYDAYLSIGLYDYIIGSLPFFWRLLARLAGLGGGSKERGIEHLETVVSNGRFANDDARVFLEAIYDREGNQDKSLELVDYLRKKYPRNYLLGVERGRLLYAKGDADEGARQFESLLNDPKTASEATDIINYQWAEMLRGRGDWNQALSKYAAVTQWPGSEQGLVSIAYLNAGQMLDVLGRRQDAIAEYRMVLERDNVYDSHDQAQSFIKNAYRLGK